MVKNLRRREFLKKAGIAGIFTMTANHVFAHNSAVFGAGNGTEGLLDKLATQTQSLQTLTDTPLLVTYQTSLIPWQQSGYQATGSGYYICQHGDLVLFPLHLHHESLGLLDQVILCFEKNKIGDWVKIRPLSGFDLEALAAAATALERYNPNIALCDYLLPRLSAKHKNPHCFSTAKGEISIKTLLSDTSSTIDVLVKEGDATLFQQKIKSKHTLTCTQGC